MPIFTLLVIHSSSVLIGSLTTCKWDNTAYFGQTTLDEQLYPMNNSMYNMP